MPKGGSLIFISVAEAFFTYMKITFIAGIILTSPFILYEVWAFIAPGLYQKEKRYVIPFVLGGSVFFSLGVLFGYFVAIPVGFRFLLGYATDFIKPMPSMKEYLSFSIKFLLAFGLVFEFAILLIFVFAAVMTPPDIISQVLMALPLMGLYELSIFLSKIFGKKSPSVSSESSGDQVESSALH
ncbi:MAG: sec-independent protein translocase protein [Deltaproteobacteria bacterium]|nr:sec-independent protein translocase protein [Deltaproteobacteria bacterium]